LAIVPVGFPLILQICHLLSLDLLTDVKHSLSKLFWYPPVSSFWLNNKCFIKEHCLVTMFGLVVTADSVLLKHEAKRRSEIGALRKEARIALARRGIIPTETAIWEWQRKRENDIECSAEDVSL
jgi:hypothetical protein